MAAVAYEVRNLRKTYSDPPVVANDGISFTCRVGEAFGLLGANGAGKTTLVRQLVGSLLPTAGEIRLFGESVRPERNVGRLVSYLPQGMPSLGELRVGEAIRSVGMLRGLGKVIATAETEELIAALQLGGIEDRPLRKLSGGQRRLVQIGMSLVCRLPVLILDEPTADIDPALRQRIWALIADRARSGAAVILVTHDVAEAERVLDRVAILDRGRVVAAGTPAELKADLAHRTRLEVVVAEPSSTNAIEIARVIGDGAKIDGRRVSGWVPADDAVRMLEKLTSSFTAETFEDVRLVTPSLEDVYLELAGRHLEENAS
ncbi:MAG: ABC transporter ATP-binding protein [Actinomycetota bacterium]